MEQRIAQLERELEQLKRDYYENNHSSLQLFNKDVSFRGKVGFFDMKPSSQGASVATVATPSGTYQQSEAQAAVTAINALIARLQSYGLLP